MADSERTSYFTTQALEAAEAIKRIVEGGEDPLGLGIRLRQLRDTSTLAARFHGEHEATPSEQQVRRVLDFCADQLGNEGEAESAFWMRDEDFRRAVMVEFGHEPPPGDGADPYGRPSPSTHPEFWRE